MFKLLILFGTLYCIAKISQAAALIATPAHVTVQEPTLAKIGHVVEQVPTAVSHQSSTIVHNSVPRLSPLLAHAVRSYTAPLLLHYAHPSSAATAFMHAHATAAAALTNRRSFAGYAPLIYAFKK